MMADLPAGGVGRYEVAIVPLCIQKWEKNSRAKNRLCKCVFLSLIPPLKSAEDIAHLVDAAVAHLLGKLGPPLPPFQYCVAAISCIDEKSLPTLKNYWILAISFVIGKKTFPFESFAICFMRILSFFGNENTRADCGGKVDLIADIAYKTLMVSNIYFIDLC